MMTKNDAIQHFGTQQKLAAALGITQPAIAAWKETIPLLRQLQLERLTGGVLKASAKAYGPVTQ